MSTEHSPQIDDLSDISLLLVDDNSINLAITCKILSAKHKIEADTAKSGQEAVNAMKAKTYDFVIMDCMMPEIDGYEASRLIRKGECGTQNRDVPIIALTANATEADKQLCLDAGMNDYLSKPIEPKDISEKLDKWLLKPQGQ
ncbi:response regulator [Puniceicoccaceae bacterium K14]|nr:response regulator [Puniceicoccaceae bacterium K14]